MQDREIAVAGSRLEQEEILRRLRRVGKPIIHSMKR